MTRKTNVKNSETSVVIKRGKLVVAATTEEEKDELTHTFPGTSVVRKERISHCSSQKPRSKGFQSHNHLLKDKIYMLVCAVAK